MKLSRFIHIVHEADDLTQWFGASKVVDAQGEPLLVYRGDLPNRTSFGDSGTTRIAGNIFFTNRANIGRNYARADLRSMGPRYMIDPSKLDASHGLYRCYLKFLKPMVVDAKGASWLAIPTARGPIQIDELAALARKKGFDSLIVHDVMDQHGDGTQYVAFGPNQVRFATGNFSDSPRIVESDTLTVGANTVPFLIEPSYRQLLGLVRKSSVVRALEGSNPEEKTLAWNAHLADHTSVQWAVQEQWGWFKVQHGEVRRGYAYVIRDENTSEDEIDSLWRKVPKFRIGSLIVYQAGFENGRRLRGQFETPWISLLQQSASRGLALHESLSVRPISHNIHYAALPSPDRTVGGSRLFGLFEAVTTQSVHESRMDELGGWINPELGKRIQVNGSTEHETVANQKLGGIERALWLGWIRYGFYNGGSYWQGRSTSLIRRAIVELEKTALFRNNDVSLFDIEVTGGDDEMQHWRLDPIQFDAFMKGQERFPAYLGEAFHIGFKNPNGVYVEVFRNPNRAEAMKLIAQSSHKRLRFWLVSTGLYVWDANLSTHDVDFDLNHDGNSASWGGQLDVHGVILYGVGDMGRATEMFQTYPELQRIYGSPVPVREDESVDVMYESIQQIAIPGYAGKGQKEIAIAINPGPDEFLALARRSPYGELRGLIDGDRVVFWAANAAEHDQVIRSMGMAGRGDEDDAVSIFASPDGDRITMNEPVVHPGLDRLFRDPRIVRLGNTSLTESQFNVGLSNGKQIRIDVNPSPQRVVAMQKRAPDGQLRFAVDVSHDFLVWIAYEAVHEAVENALGVPFLFSGEIVSEIRVDSVGDGIKWPKKLEGEPEQIRLYLINTYLKPIPSMARLSRTYPFFIDL